MIFLRNRPILPWLWETYLSEMLGQATELLGEKESYHEIIEHSNVLIYINRMREDIEKRSNRLATFIHALQVQFRLEK
jgi:hypothetical protein